MRPSSPATQWNSSPKPPASRAATAHGPIYLEATREDCEKLVNDAGFSEVNVAVREMTLHQDKIRATTIENASQYKSATGYAFPDQIVVGVSTK